MPNNEIWFFTDGGGINIYNTKTNKFSFIKSNPNLKNGLSSNYIYTSYLDKNNRLWLGTLKNGVSLYDNDNPFSTYKITTIDNNQIMNHPIASVFVDSNKTVWVGSDGNGLYKFVNNKLQHIIFDKNIITIPAINQINKYQLIIGTYKHGISLFDIKKKYNHPYKKTK